MEEETKQVESGETPDINTLKEIINKLRTGLCWYLLKVANKELNLGGHIRIIQGEIITGGTLKKDDALKIGAGVGFFFGVLNFHGILFNQITGKNGNIKLEISPEVIDLIKKRLNI